MTCSISKCAKNVLARGLCSAHYRRWQIYGDPLGGGPTPGWAREWLEAHISYQGVDCLIWPFNRFPDGYGQVNWNRKMSRVHRVMCELAHGAPPTPEHEAAHSCGRGKFGCCNQRHLSWKTRAENEADKIGHGTSNRGERQGSSKLTAADVIAIRAARGTVSQAKLGERYGVHQSTIKDIQLRKRWAWLP